MLTVMTTKENNREMRRFALYRIAGHIAHSVILLKSLSSTGAKLDEILPHYPELQIFVDLGPIFATIWNIAFQLVYIFYGLICDLAQLCNKDHLIPEKVKNYRNTMFTGLVGPYAWGIFLVFWPLYIYDRELVFPSRADLVMTAWDNHSVHTCIVSFVLWEAAYLPKGAVKGGPVCINHILAVNVLYTYAALHARFYAVGAWPYDILTVTKASFLHYVFVTSLCISGFAGYFIQLWVADSVWNYRDKSRKDKGIIENGSVDAKKAN